MDTQNYTHKDLDVWKLSMEVVFSVYRFTDKFPNKEQFGLTNQIRRCAVSIPSNIAEGSARKGNTEFIQFLHIALGSLAELETQLLIANGLNYLTQSEFDDLNQDLQKVGKLLNGLIRYRKTK